MEQSLISELSEHLTLCGEAYELVQEENLILNSPTPKDAYAHADRRKELLERVTGSMVRVKAHKALWEKLSPAERAKSMNISSLIKQNMDLIMKTVMLDRENEKLMLQHGMAPPDRLPSSRQNNPTAVAGMYQRHST
ncbi:MAG: hypothetical protein QF600_07880 [Verrucomicrobiota bacterium]|jgi:hypothetical protein|nr:hypothetical protein [Verrucomicrobiota bacterium]